MPSRNHKVAVVGGGLAGLTAAYELSKHQRVDVTLFEADARVGGRVRSVDIAGVSVDLGAFLVFPWYRRYRGLCDELGIGDDLLPVPPLEVYYDVGNGELITDAQFGFHLDSLVKVGAKSLAGAFLAGRLDHPKLDYYKRRSIAECIDHWDPDPAEAAKYKRLVDTLCQGYCYPPIDQYKAAFALPIYPRTLLAGDAQHSDIFRHSSKELPMALHVALTQRGAEVRLGSEVTGFDGLRLQTADGAFDADAVVFAMPADHPLFRDLVPPVARAIDYTSFITAVVELEAPYQEATPDWGAIFFTPNNTQEPQILSMINIERLYRAEQLANTYTLNVRVNNTNTNTDQVLMDCIQSTNPAMGAVNAIRARAVWTRAMPISIESTVKVVRALQGTNRAYFAGDYLGCPSMEVAVETGHSAARAVIRALA